MYIAKPQKYLESKQFFGPKSLAYIMDKLSSVDVDDLLDYEFVKFLMEKRLKGLL